MRAAAVELGYDKYSWQSEQLHGGQRWKQCDTREDGPLYGYYCMFIDESCPDEDASSCYDSELECPWELYSRGARERMDIT